MNRREFLEVMGFSSMNLLLAKQLWANDDPSDVVPNVLDDLYCLSDIVLPETDTPSAGQVGVHKWLLRAAKHRLEGVTPEHLTQFCRSLKSASVSFSGLPSHVQIEHLTRIDEAAFNQRDKSDQSVQWRSIKSLILLGYYTSKEGATDELQYDPLPGALNNQLKINPDDARAWSSDWTAVMFS